MTIYVIHWIDELKIFVFSPKFFLVINTYKEYFYDNDGNFIARIATF